MDYRIFMGNIGYARGINGEMQQHLRYGYRHMYCPVGVQQQALKQLKSLLDAYNPHLGGLVEIDQGSANSAWFNQLDHIVSERYPHIVVENKYHAKGLLRRMPIMGGKSNAVFSAEKLPVRRHDFSVGAKRLFYEAVTPIGVRVFFVHFALRRAVRARQFAELRQHVDAADTPVVIMGDFNIFSGIDELTPLMMPTDLHVLNDWEKTTFQFGKRKMTLDLCIVSDSIMDRCELTVVPQDYSDHDALLLNIS